jgi:LysR family transcriptional activator of nhaA
VIEREVCRRYAVQVVGRAGEIRQRYYAISMDRRLRNPAVVALCDVARKKIFG